MAASRKHEIEISAEARKIEARNGGSITKNRMTPETSATTLAIIAKTMLTVRSCVIARLPIAGHGTNLLTPRRVRVYAVEASCTVAWRGQLGVLN